MTPEERTAYLNDWHERLQREGKSIRLTPGQWKTIQRARDVEVIERGRKRMRRWRLWCAISCVACFAAGVVVGVLL